MYKIKNGIDTTSPDDQSLVNLFSNNIFSQHDSSVATLMMDVKLPEIQTNPHQTEVSIHEVQSSQTSRQQLKAYKEE
jgi:hypothetical protein